MDYALNEEEVLFQKSIKEFFKDNWTREMMRNQFKEGFSHEIWKKMASNELMAIGLDETLSLDDKMIYSALIHEELGRNLVCLPYLSTVDIAGPLIAKYGNKEQKHILEGILDGKITIGLLQSGLEMDAFEDACLVRATSHGNCWRIYSSDAWVPFGKEVDFILCAATKDNKDDDRNLILFLVPVEIFNRQEVVRYSSTNIIGQPISKVSLKGLKLNNEMVLGSSIDDYLIPYLDTITKARILVSAGMVGGSKATIDLAVQHAKERIQFGHPIGSFQAIQHKLANNLILYETARYVVYKSAWMANKGLDFHSEAIAAKLLAGEAFVSATSDGCQVLGGTGFMIESDMHLYFRKAIIDDGFLGTDPWLNKRLGEQVLSMNFPKSITC